MIRAVDAAWQEIRDISDVTNDGGVRSYFAALIFTSASPCFALDVAALLRNDLLVTHDTFFSPAHQQNKTFALFWRQIRELEWFHYLRDAFHKALNSVVLTYVHKVCRARYDEPIFTKILSWRRGVFLPWLQSAVCLHQMQTSEKLKQKEKIYMSMSLTVEEKFVDLRISEMYDIITEFPESVSAVQELKGPLERTHRHKKLAHSVREMLQRRLLHPGASTSQIIDVFSSSVKVLQILKSSVVDSLVDIATGPVRSYLKKRKDTARCIAASLTDQSNSDLHHELCRTDSQILEISVESDDEMAPLQATPKTAAQVKLLPMLISIYDSPEVFVGEYRLILCDKWAIFFVS